ncbi:porphobilinogen synthase, partial [Bacteriovoracaceae bacterium]|nr:porphobilinogen synthase [Bacteriovoracaceae bacterium]
NIKYSQTFRRLRKNRSIRKLVEDVELESKHLIQPYFIYEALSKEEDLKSIARQKKHTLDSILKELGRGLENGVNAALLFFIPEHKAKSHFDYSFDVKVLTAIKERFGSDLNLFTDICLCSNTDTGHCGFVSDQGVIENDKSVIALAQKAVAYAQGGADGLCPSDMMDDRVLAIRRGLDEANLSDRLVMSYSTKYSSAFYGPFRDAAESTPSSGDRKSYQIDPRNSKDGIRCSIRDAEQGADILMVKPAGAYLDVIHQIKNHSFLKNHPLAAYQVSGEYQGLYVCAENGLFDFDSALLESLIAIRRAGADLIVSYAANDFKNIQEN